MPSDFHRFVAPSFWEGKSYFHTFAASFHSPRLRLQTRMHSYPRSTRRNQHKQRRASDIFFKSDEKLVLHGIH
eukprot:5889960-Amphidinium_carterae.1